MKELKPVNREIDFTKGKAMLKGVRKALLGDKTDSEIFRECQQIEDRMFKAENGRALKKASE